MTNNRWIRTNCGFAGRNGYIIKVRSGYDGYFYGDPNSFGFTHASEAKKALDNPKNLAPVGIEVTD